VNLENIGNTGDKLTSQLRDAAHTLGSMIAVVWLLAGIGYAILDPWTWKSELVIAFLFFLALSVGIAWWKEGVGGIMLVVLSVAFGTFVCVEATRNQALAWFISGGPFLIVGILFLVTWQRAKKTASPAGYNGSSNTTPTGIDVQGGV
jgi:heme/copper-type cytochrome/quinol oxidase subunit 2